MVTTLEARTDGIPSLIIVKEKLIEEARRRSQKQNIENPETSVLKVQGDPNKRLKPRSKPVCFYCEKPGHVLTFVGYSDQSKALRFLDKNTNKIIISRDYKVMESEIKKDGKQIGNEVYIDILAPSKKLTELNEQQNQDNEVLSNQDLTSNIEEIQPDVNILSDEEFYDTEINTNSPITVTDEEYVEEPENVSNSIVSVNEEPILRRSTRATKGKRPN